MNETVIPATWVRNLLTAKSALRHFTNCRDVQQHVHFRSFVLERDVRKIPIPLRHILLLGKKRSHRTRQDMYQLNAPLHKRLLASVLNYFNIKQTKGFFLGFSAQTLERADLDQNDTIIFSVGGSLRESIRRILNIKFTIIEHFSFRINANSDVSMYNFNPKTSHTKFNPIVSHFYSDFSFSTAEKKRKAKRVSVIVDGASYIFVVIL